MKMVERRPGIWPAERELLELVRGLLEEEERERKERALGRIRPWEVHDEATTALTSGMADACERGDGGERGAAASSSVRRVARAALWRCRGQFGFGDPG